MIFCTAFLKISETWAKQKNVKNNLYNHSPARSTAQSDKGLKARKTLPKQAPHNESVAR